MTARAMRRQLNRRLTEAGHDVTAAQLIVMGVLSRGGAFNQQLIAEISGKDKTSTTRMIDTMERHGLVQRVPDPDDRRQNRILLTEKGRAEQQEMMAHIYATHEQAAEGIPKGDLDQCKEVLRRVLNNLIQADPTWPCPHKLESNNGSTRED